MIIRSYYKNVFSQAVAACILLVAADACLATTANWSASDLDTWVYNNAGGAGFRLEAPSFTGGFSLDINNDFVEHTSNDPARLGSMMVAFDTSTSITSGLLPEQYSIQSVTVTARVEHSGPGTLLYEEQSPTPAEYLAEFSGSGLNAQKPMELFGVGFRDGYVGYDFAGGSSDPTLFKEATTPYSASDGGYVPYPIVGDLGMSSQYHDVSNNVTGGFSATDSLNHTDPFYAEPWAVGTAGLSIGSSVPNDTTFTFDLDLGAAGVLTYVQQALADGGLGFIIGSLHSTAEFGGGGAYPVWYTKEASGIFPGAEAPTLEIQYSVLPRPGDFNNDSNVDTTDYNLWKTSFGQASGYDGTDFLDWQKNFVGPAPALAAAVIPEPNSLALALAGLLLTSRAFPTSRKFAQRIR